MAARVVTGASRSGHSSRAPGRYLRRAPSHPASSTTGTHLPRAVTTALAAPGGGRPLEAKIRARIEPHLGIDLGHVRVRQGPDAAGAAHALHARAFTSGSTIFLGAGSSPTDVGLMAHEAVHVAQQESAVAQATLLRDVTDFLPDVSAEDLIPDWILDGVRSAVRALPGYGLLTVVTGSDPLTSEPVEVGREELVESLLTRGPFGAAVGPVLRTIDVLGDVVDLIAESLAAHDLTIARVRRDIDAAWDELSIDGGIAGNVAVVARYVDAFLSDAGAFVESLVDRVLEIVRAVAADVAEPLLQTPEIGPLWSLTTKVLHRDPLRGVDVAAPPVEILADFLRLAGQEQRLTQMQERGTLEETADWLDTQFATFGDLLTGLGTLFADAWAAISPQNLPELPTNVAALARRAFDLAGRVARFAATVLERVLELVKDALLGWLSSHARGVPGFPLLTVIVGQDPFTGEPVLRTAENLIRGFVTLLPGGEETYAQLATSGVIGTAAGRIEGEMSRLGISLDIVTGLFHGIWDTLGLDDLLRPLDAFARVLALFGEPLARLVEFVGVVIEVVVSLVLALMNFPTDLLASIIGHVQRAITDISRDPVAFLTNMLLAVRAGLASFLDNILRYLVEGLAAWLFRGLGALGITAPPDLSPGSILTLVLQVLGITADALWGKLGKHLGEGTVATVRGGIARLSGAWTFVKDVQEGGIGAVWRHVTDRLAGLWDALLQMARDWVVTTVVQRATVKLLSLLDPSGVMAVINGFIAFFNAVQSAVEYLRDILAIVERYVSTLASVAAGDVVPGARMLEQGLAAAIPVAIGFLANQVGLGNVPEKVVEIIGRLRELVDQALDWLVAQAVRLGRAALASLGVGDRPDTPENRKRAALEEIEAAMTRGIRRNALIALLRSLRTRLQLRRCELVRGSDVVVENSDPELVEGHLYFTPEEVRELTQLNYGLPGGPAGGDLHVGEFKAQVTRLPTIRAVLEEHMGPAEWPTDSAMPNQAARPERVSASLKGRIDIVTEGVPRISSMTRMVGNMGDFERAFHRGNWSGKEKYFVGGHVIGHQFGGLEEYDNLVPMLSSLNGKLYLGVETFIKQTLPRIPVGTDTAPLPAAMEIVVDLSYGADPIERVSRLASIIASKFKTDQEAKDRFEQAVHPPSFRQRVSFPARIPTGISLLVTVLTGPPPESTEVPGAPAGTVETAMTRSMAATRVLDPFIRRQHPGQRPEAKGRGRGATPGPRQWARRWRFTQENE
ncbi:DUF4157 domain-containing protein [Geodermatophilus sp. SYSU D00758]